MDLTRGFGASLETSVGAVLASDADSIELSVEVMLCLEVVRRMLAEELAWLGLRVNGLAEV